MKVLVAGDYCPQYRVAELFNKNDFAEVLGEIKGVVDKVDYSIVNFECPVSNGAEKPIQKHGPKLCCSIDGIEALKWVGFNCITLANNHFYDYGDEGVKNTVDACNKNMIDYVGGGINLEKASAVLYKRIRGMTLAIINCCEHEFSIATEVSGGSNPLNPIRQYASIQEARKKADYVLVIVHGGHEMFQLPSPRMKETYRFFIDAGADAVVNHHQHCFSGYEVYKEKPIFYGLGNFCFDEKGSMGGIWNEGYFVVLSFADSISFEIIPYNQCDDKPIVKILPSNVYNQRISELNKTIQDENVLSEKVKEYYRSCLKQSSYIFEPLMNRVYSSLRYRGILPSLVTNKRKLLAYDFIVCESHRDKILEYLKV